MNIFIKIFSLLPAALLIFLLPLGPTFSQEGGEETYSISLVQTAESDKEIHEIEGRKVLTETYTVRKGDHLWQLLRKRGLLEKRELPELLAALKRLNSTFSNLDLIHPGEKIMIPLTLSPVKGLAGILPKEPPQPIPLADLKDLKLESYTVRPGDSLIKIVKTHYGLSDHQITEECLEQIHRLNPQIADLNILYPDQMVRLPVHTPHFVRAPVKPAGEKRMRVEGQKAGSPSADKEFTALGYQLQEIFTLMGEEWVNTGEHYIPLRSGGQINLKAESFPVANLSNGKRIVVDLYRELPERMAYVITSNWENYRVAQIQDRDDLRSALNKIFPLCEFHKLYRSGEPFELVGDIYFRITADWIIIPSPDPQGSREQAILINLPDEKGPRIPHELKDFLAVQGIKTIEYPPLSSLEPASPFPSEVLKAGHDKARIIETVLNLAGQAFTRNMELPLHSDGKGGFSMTVKADFFLYLDKKEAIIDFSGIGNEMIPLLNEYKVSVLSVAAEADPGIIVSKILEFIGIRFDSKPRAFTTAGSGESKNIMVTIPGISFQDETGKSIFASSVDIPDEIAGFLSRKGYKVLSLSSS